MSKIHTIIVLVLLLAGLIIGGSLNQQYPSGYKFRLYQNPYVRMHHILHEEQSKDWPQLDIIIETESILGRRETKARAEEIIQYLEQNDWMRIQGQEGSDAYRDAIVWASQAAHRFDKCELTIKIKAVGSHWISGKCEREIKQVENDLMLIGMERPMTFPVTTTPRSTSEDRAFLMTLKVVMDELRIPKKQPD